MASLLPDGLNLEYVPVAVKFALFLDIPQTRGFSISISVLLITVFLLVGQASALISEQIPDSAHATSKRVTQRGYHSPHDNSQRGLPARHIIAQEDQRESVEHTKNQNSPIVISELPPVRIVNKGRDWVTAANDLLVLVGFCGIGTAIWTLHYLRRQIKEMSLQRGAMVQQNLQMVAKERARLGIQIPNVYDATGIHWLDFNFTVTNSGPTNAYNVQASVQISLLLAKAQPSREFSAIFIPTMIKPEGKPTLVMGNSYNIDSSTGESLKNGSKFFHFSGMITYEDVFGNKRYTPFHYRLMVTENTWGQEPEPYDSMWLQDGPTSDNEAT